MPAILRTRSPRPSSTPCASRSSRPRARSRRPRATPRRWPKRHVAWSPGRRTPTGPRSLPTGRPAARRASTASTRAAGARTSRRRSPSSWRRPTRACRVMVKGQPKTEEVIPLAALKESINKAVYGYTDKHLGPKEEIGNKGAAAVEPSWRRPPVCRRATCVKLSTISPGPDGWSACARDSMHFRRRSPAPHRPTNSKSPWPWPIRLRSPTGPP